MQPLTLEQLRAAARAGGVASVTLKAAGPAFVIAIATRSGGHGLLVTTRSKEPRRFTDLRKAMLLLRDIGIATAVVDAEGWTPDAPADGARRPDRAAALKRAHEAAAHDRWFRAEVERGLREADDPSAILYTHDQVVADTRATIDRIAGKKSRRRAR
jgi:hypothetical protein